MLARTLTVKESPVYQWPEEAVTFTLTTTNYGSAPTSPSMTIKDSNDNDVTSTLAPSGSPSVSGDVITWPEITGVTAGETYTVIFQFTAGGGAPFAPRLILIGQRDE